MAVCEGKKMSGCFVPLAGREWVTLFHVEKDLKIRFGTDCFAALAMTII